MFFSPREVPFRRPGSSVFFRIANAIMPPQPPAQVRLGYGDIKRHFRLYHYAIGVVMLATFMSLVVLQVQLWSVLAWNPISTTIRLFEWAYNQGVPVLLGTVVCSGAVVAFSVNFGKKPSYETGYFSDSTIGFFNRAAVKEEQWFREGSENWSRPQRFTSCFCFGFVHMANLFYPYATILPLSLCGYLFMRVYLKNFEKTHDREQAVLASAVMHRLYNRLALTLALGAIAYLAFVGLRSLVS